MAKLGQADEAFAAGKPIADVGRSLGVSAGTPHSQRAEDRAVEGDDVSQLKDLKK